ncbi:hypothetical protein BG004_003840 [Podila humilis]|nr:hypothetical protein BG004_003840 [Podila humilis]
MDDLVLHVQHEVALDGSSGCSWDRFWFLVDDFLRKNGTLSSAEPLVGDNAPPSGRTDERYREFFWNNFIEEDGMAFYRTKEPFVSPVGPSRAFSTSIEGATLCTEEDLYYTAITDDIKSRLRITTAVDKQQHAVYGNALSNEIKSELGYKVLQTITAAREHGATQAQLAKDFGIDPRSMYHHIKQFIQQKLVVKIPVTTDGTYTLLCLRTQFAAQNPGYMAMNAEELNKSTHSKPLVSSDTGARFEGLLKTDSKSVSYYSAFIKHTITELVSKAKHQIMAVDDLAKALDLSDMTTVQNRWFNRQIEQLCSLKYIHRVIVPGMGRCVKFLKHFRNGTITDEGIKANLKAFISDEGQRGLCIDTSMEQQVLEIIEEAGNEGIVGRTIGNSLNKIHSRLLSKVLNSLAKTEKWRESPPVHRVTEFLGRERRYRYYSAKAFNASIGQEHKEYIAQAKRQSINTRKSSASAASDSQQAAVSVVAAAATAATATAGNNDLDQPSDPSSAPNSTLPTGSWTQTEQSTQDEPLSALHADVGSAAADKPTVVAAPEKFISVALMQRRKIIMAIMQEKRMVEIHATLLAEFHRQKAILFPAEPGNHVTDRRTVFRTITVLESEGLLKIVRVENVPMIGGGLTTKSFCLLPEIEANSDEVKKFIKENTSRQMLFGQLSHKPSREVERVDVEVESLDEMASRLGPNLTQAIKIPFSELGAVTLPKPRPNRHALGADFEGSQYALQFGWYRAKMLRALVFHRYLLDKLANKDSQLYPYAGRPHLLKTGPIHDLLPLRVFLQVVGITVKPPTPECEAFLEESRLSQIPLQNLPEHTLFLSMPSNNFTKRLREALEVLDALGLVSPVVEYSQDFNDTSKELVVSKNHLIFHTHYDIHVNVEAPLDHINPSDIDSNVDRRKKYNLLSASECRNFWVDLQTSASRMSNIPEPLDRIKASAQSWSVIRRNFLQNMGQRRFWTDPIQITAGQQQALMSYANQEKLYIPLAAPLIAEIASETALPKEHIIRFYRALLVRWKSKVLETAQTKAKKAQVRAKRGRLTRIRAPIVQIADDGTQETSEAWRMRALLGADDARVETSGRRENRFSTRGSRKKRAKRTAWTDEDTETLMMANAIVRYIVAVCGLRFSWLAPARCMGVESSNIAASCRHRYAKLVHNPRMAHKMEYYRTMFAHMYSDIVQKFPQVDNILEFDPRPMLAYFREHLPQSQKDMADMTKLNVVGPNTFHYAVREAEPYASLYVEERLYKESSWQRQLEVLNSMPVTLRAINNRELDFWSQDFNAPRMLSTDAIMEEGEEEADAVVPKSLVKNQIVVRDEPLVPVNNALTVIRTIYATPISRKSLQWTQEILGDLSPSIIQEACVRGREWKVLLELRANSYRIPGQRVGRSERFSQVMAGAFPRILSLAASDAATMMEQRTSWEFEENATAADMMVLVNMLAADRLKLTFKHPEQVMPDDEEIYYLNGRLAYVIRIENVSPPAAAAAAAATSSSSSSVIPKPGRKRIADRDEFEEEDGGGDGIVEAGSRSNNSSKSSNKKMKESATASQRSSEQPTTWEEVRVQTVGHLHKYLDTVPDAGRRRFLEDIFTVVMTSAASGMTLLDIKASLDVKGDERDSDIVQAVKIMEGMSPPLFIRVGVSYQRYVVFGWHEQWTFDYDGHQRRLFAKPDNNDNDNDDNNNDKNEKNKKNKKDIKKNSTDNSIDVDDDCVGGGGWSEAKPVHALDWHTPLIWRTVEKTLDSIVFEKCLHAVLTIINELPGISKGKIQRSTFKILSPFELDELLDELERRKAIRVSTGINPKPATLFSKPGQFLACERDRIHERKVTNYFPSLEYYKHLDMEKVTADGAATAVVVKH